MHRKILILGLFFSLLAVVLGAFGAHALKALVSQEKLQIFETGVRYQFMHAIALIALSLYGSQNEYKMGEQKAIGWAAHFFFNWHFLIQRFLVFINPALYNKLSNGPFPRSHYALGWSKFYIGLVYLAKGRFPS
jgi:hypothetical protein